MIGIEYNGRWDNMRYWTYFKIQVWHFFLVTTEDFHIELDKILKDTYSNKITVEEAKESLRWLFKDAKSQRIVIE